jgi:hypothetical protein
LPPINLASHSRDLAIFDVEPEQAHHHVFVLAELL